VCVDSWSNVKRLFQRWWTTDADALSAIASTLKADNSHQSAPINGSVGHPHTGWLPVPQVSHHFSYGVDGTYALPAACGAGTLKPEPRPDRVVLFGARGMMGPAAVDALAASGVRRLLVTDVPVGSGKIDTNQEKRRLAETL
jgi:hypothetical protein